MYDDEESLKKLLKQYERKKREAMEAGDDEEAEQLGRKIYITKKKLEDIEE
jgi:hypothetical protein